VRRDFTKVKNYMQLLLYSSIKLEIAARDGYFSKKEVIKIYLNSFKF